MKSARRRSREFALQGLYQWQLAGHRRRRHPHGSSPRTSISTRPTPSTSAPLLDGTIADAAALSARSRRCSTASVELLSPVERGILLLAACELKHAPEVPYRVVINEAVELAKSYGGTDGHKYVNGVLDKLVAALRPREKSR